MGSPLGVLFAEAYMAHVESITIDRMGPKPFTYCRYVDDIFVDIQSEQELLDLKARLEAASVLKFTTEISVNNKIPFLDVAVDASGASYVTSVHRKPTDNGNCLNGLSESPDRYKASVIRSYIHRALTHCTTWALIHQELDRIKHLLVNNNYSLTDIDKQIRRQLHKHFLPPNRKHNHETQNTGVGPKAQHDRTEVDERNTTAQHDTDPEPPHDTSEGGKEIPFFYQSRMSTAYKTEEKAIRDIVTRNCIPSNNSDTIRLTIYYKSPRVSNLVMCNNLSRDNSLLKATNIVYEYKCQIGECAHRRNSSYIGHTTTTLSRRMTMHLQSGGPMTHTVTDHGRRLQRSDLENNTKILTKCPQYRKLKILEAVYIRDKDPSINRQLDMRGTLWLCDGQPLEARI